MDKKIKEIFEEFILKANQELSEEKRQIFLHGSVNADSYFETPRFPTQLAFQLLELNTKEELEQLFSTLWKDEPRLLAMIGPMLAHAFELRSHQTTQSDDLNSFIYTLY